MKYTLPLYTTLIASLVLLSFSKKLDTLTKHEIDFPNAQTSKEQSQLIFNSIKAFPTQTEFSVAFIQHGELSFMGVQKQEGEIAVVENHQHAFEIGSLTKVFTATLLANLVIDQKLNLEDNIQDHLDFHINTDQAISFQHLANHSSGLPRLPSNFEVSAENQANPFKHYDREKLIEYLSSASPLTQAPGTNYAYSNLGSGLLGFTLASVSQASYEALLQAQIFDKYAMRNSSSKRERLSIPLVKGLDPTGEITPNWDFEVLAGAGAILSTVEDLSTFALAQFDKNHKELALTHAPTFKINDQMRIGLGWHILTKGKDSEWLWHNGATGGYRSSMALDLSHQSGIIILSNVSAFHKKAEKIDQLCFKLMRTLGKG